MTKVGLFHLDDWIIYSVHSMYLNFASFDLIGLPFDSEQIVASCADIVLLVVPLVAVECRICSLA